MKRIIAVILTVCMVLALGVTSSAAETKNITASYRDVTIVADGTPIVPRDASGRPVEPFIYNGATYLPVRAVADALGVSVAWDEATSTITLTRGGEPTAAAGQAMTSYADKAITATYRDIKLVVDGKTIVPKDANGNTVDPFIYNGTTYLPVRAVADALGVAVEWDPDTYTVYLGERIEWAVSKEESTYDGYKTTSTYTYDKQGNLTGAKYVDNDGTDTTAYTYDAAGNCTSEKYSDSNGYTYTYTYTFDAAGNQTSEKYSDSDGSAYTYTYTYDAAGNLIRQTYQDDGWDFAFDYNYNAQNQLVSVKTSYADGTSYLEKYTYDAPGNLTEQVNTGSDGFTSTTRYTYNARGDMLTIRYSDSDGWTYTTEYTYDAAGRMTRYSNRDSEYGDTLETYVYDAAGNCLENTYSNTCDGVTWSYSYKYTYDAGNRLIREVGTETDGTVTTTEYTYDAEGRPVTVSETSGGTTTTYAITYDLGNNIIRVVSTAPGVSNEMKFEYDKHGNMILEDYGLGNITRTEYIAIKK